jgi:hypothetical protein
MTFLHLHFDFVEQFAANRVSGASAGKGLPTADDGVDISWVEFQPVAAPSGAFRRNQGRPAAEKSVEDEVAPRRAIHDGVGHECDRLDGRVQGQEVAFLTRFAEGSRARIFPNVGAVPAESPELNIVAVGAGHT